MLMLKDYYKNYDKWNVSIVYDGRKIYQNKSFALKTQGWHLTAFAFTTKPLRTDMHEKKLKA